MNEAGQFSTEPQGQPFLTPAYQPPPRPPRKPMRTFFKVILTLFVLVIFFLFGLVLLAVVALKGERDGVAFGDRIGLVRISGAIRQGEDAQFWIDSLRKLGDDNGVKGVIVRIDSPGGTVGASQEIYKAVIDCKKKKTVFVSMGDMAASGGYYIASAGDKIFANKGTMTGSIGVIISLPDLSVLTDRLGIAEKNIKSGKFKDSGSIMRKMTAEEQAMFQGLIDNTYGQFLADVLEFRKPAIDKALKKFPETAWSAYGFTKPSAEETSKTLAMTFLRQVADGRVYTGEQALELGLVDKLGGLEDAIGELGRQKRIKGRPTVYEPRKKRSIFEMIESRVGDVLPSSQSPLQYKMVLP
ncbi:MAG: signal peptide peptidase SppA [Candidatus Sumerlaeia bacterium]